MGYVLVPGDVYLCQPVPEIPTASPEITANVNALSGVHLLATSKQAYQEGHTIFYAFNTFYLPPTMTFSWCDRLLAKHNALTKRISITIGLVELTPAMLTEIQNRMPAGVGTENGPENGHRWAKAVGGALIDSWYSKLENIADWDSLEEFELRSFGRIYHFQHHEVIAFWKRGA